MIRFIVILLLLFIVYNLVKFFFRALTGTGSSIGRTPPKKKKSKYEDVEDAKFKDIEDNSKKDDKS